MWLRGSPWRKDKTFCGTQVQKWNKYQQRLFMEEIVKIAEYYEVIISCIFA